MELNHVQMQQMILTRLKNYKNYYIKTRNNNIAYLLLLDEKIRLVNNNCYKSIPILLNNSTMQDAGYRLVRTNKGMCFSNGEKSFPPAYTEQEFNREGYTLATEVKPHWVRLKGDKIEIYECERHPYIDIATAIIQNENLNEIIFDIKGKYFKEYKIELPQQLTPMGLTENTQNIEELERINKELIKELQEEDNFDY